LAVCRETEPYGGVRERSLLILLKKRFYANGNWLLVQLLASAEILAQNRENLLFESIQRLAIPIYRELIAHGCKDTIHIKEYNSLTGTADKSYFLGYRMACRGA
jgi:hypothetical protein